MDMLLITAQAAAGTGPAGYMSLGIQLVLLFAVFYFFIIRPQQKRAKDHRNKIDAMAKGDTVVTAGGLIGKVVRVDGDEAEIEIAAGVKVRVVRATIADIRPRGLPAND